MQAIETVWTRRTWTVVSCGPEAEARVGDARGRRITASPRWPSALRRDALVITLGGGVEAILVDDLAATRIVRLAFTFSKDTPIEIIGAFAGWRVAEEEWGTGEAAPELPSLETSFGDEPFDADTHLGNFFGDDPMEGLLPLQEAALWRYLVGWPGNAYFPATPSTALRWDPYGGRWSLTTRTLPKEDPYWVQSMIAPLGRWATEGTPERPWFAGYILDEHSRRPVLVWSVGQAPFQFEGEFEDH